MEADRMRNLILDSNCSRKIGGIGGALLRVDDRPISMAYELLKANAFVTSPYRNPVIGWRADIEINHLRFKETYIATITLTTLPWSWFER